MYEQGQKQTQHGNVDLHQNRCVFSFFLKVKMLFDFIDDGNLFQREGPATLNEQSPITLLLLGITRRVVSRPERRPSLGGI